MVWKVVGVTGTVTTVAGNYSEFGFVGGYSGDSGEDLSAGLYHPAMIAMRIRMAMFILLTYVIIHLAERILGMVDWLFKQVSMCQVDWRLIRLKICTSETQLIMSFVRSIDIDSFPNGSGAADIGLSCPSGLAINPTTGDLFIADVRNNVVVKVVF